MRLKVIFEALSRTHGWAPVGRRLQQGVAVAGKSFCYRAGCFQSLAWCFCLRQGVAVSFACIGELSCSG
ncbi:hypothetical protein BRADI_3g30940v3 [Brachypodium distachyon]|uniref:Uncharacterized protein n=1 Tax=Brachypodium distachyon TaxID=15368 RepID=A0A2K2D0C2_BRADI|nr:hypothetical protein BRADI_3g30940v3 [Brachypodium distachyon]